jgi:hypothetical protein
MQSVNRLYSIEELPLKAKETLPRVILTSLSVNRQLGVVKAMLCALSAILKMVDSKI